MKPVLVERLYEGRWAPPWVRHEHLARYEWAAAFAAGRRVIDVACGSGYGARTLLAAGAAGVDGFDLSTEAIVAAGSYPVPGARFVVADATALPCPPAAYDLFVSFETIEHVADASAMLREVARVLKPGGVFLCSTPNRAVMNPGTPLDGKPYNPFHVREYSRAELAALLGGHFPSVSLLGQSFRGCGYVGALGRLGAVWPRLAARAHQAVKVLGIPWEGRERHWPQPLQPGREPEILVTVCRTAG